MDNKGLQGMIKKFSDAQPQRAPLVDPIAKTLHEENQLWQERAQSDYNFAAQGNAGNPLAGRWNRALKHEEGLESSSLKQEYAAIKGNCEKALFRQRWAKRKHSQFQEKCQHLEQFSKTDTHRGKWMSLKRMAWKEGGGREGMRAATRYALRCVVLGMPWAKFSEWTGQWKFVYVEEGFEEDFRQEWTIKKQWMSEQVPYEPKKQANQAKPKARYYNKYATKKASKLASKQASK